MDIAYTKYFVPQSILYSNQLENIANFDEITIEFQCKRIL